jgi:DUF1680 family protein
MRKVRTNVAHEVIPPAVRVPASGVQLTGGVLQQAHANNIGYLKSLSMDALLYWFRVKAGLPAPGQPYRGHFEDNIKGQSAALFLMGAANGLRWAEDDELHQRVDEIVDGIEVACEPDGFFEPIPQSEFGTKEYPNYVRVWMNYGLKAAGMIGNRKALPLMRGMQSWFNRCDERAIAQYLMLAFQGVIANTTVYLSEVGLPEDLQTTVDYYQENWWLGQFIRGDEGAIHKRPTPHGTELEAITAYMDLYMATGKPLYLNAVNAAYRMFQDKWQHVGGGIVAIENTDIAPGCYWLDPVHKYNELCCSAHWIYLNQRYHRLYPDVEKYVSEIEKSLYNVVVANQIRGEHIRYHAFIDLQKDGDRSTPVSCCAGIGTRILGSLPEFLYALAPDGLYVDIYAGSQINWQIDGVPVQLVSETAQPTGGAVQLRLWLPSPHAFTLRLRIPGWTGSPVPVSVNGEEVAVGEPGTYCVLTRTWCPGDVVTFDLPMPLRVTRYVGADQVPGMERYAVEYGPLLLGVVGNLDLRGKFIGIQADPANPAGWLLPVAGKPGHFTVLGKPGYEYVPYHEIQDELFTCYPVISKPV